jgi:insertion element IS1 protein InsB
MRESMPPCPSCQSDSVVKNGRTRHGKQKTYNLMEQLLLEKIPLAGIARVLKVSEGWLQTYVNIKYENISQKVEVEPKPKGRLTVQMDELWSFVDDKNNKQWVWLAIDAKTREIVGCYIGDRSAQSAQKL